MVARRQIKFILRIAFVSGTFAALGFARLAYIGAHGPRSYESAFEILDPINFAALVALVLGSAIGVICLVLAAIRRAVLAWDMRHPPADLDD